MGQTTQRAFALSLAILFLITTVGFSAYVVWEMTSKKSAEPSIQQQLQEQANQQNNQTNEQKETMKDFTPLGDTRLTELKITDIKVGDGTEAKESATVKVEYTGALAKNGTIFDSTDSRGGEATEFSLNGVIPGFKQGIIGMKVGGERQILIPASLGYGEAGSPPSIPGDSDLVFNVKLVEVK